MQSWQLLSASKTITIHNSQSQAVAPIAEYNPHRGIVNCAVYNHTGKVIASCGQDGKIALHSAQRCQDKLLELTYHGKNQEPSSINACMFSPKSKFIAAGSVNSTVKIWDMKTNKQKEPTHKLKGHAGAVTSIAWMNNQQLIASSSTSGDILVHDVSLGSIRDSLTYSSRTKQGINNIKVSQGEGYRRLAACTNSGSVFVWDVNASTKRPTYTYEDPKKSSFTCLSISLFRPVFMACSSIDSSIIFMDINQRKIIKTFCTEQPLTSIAFNEDGQIIAAGGMNGGLMIYDLRKIQTPLFRLTGHDTPLKSVCFGQKQKDKENKDKQKIRAKDKQYSISSGYSKNIQTGQRSATDIPIDKQPRNKTLTPVVSTAKLGTEQQRNNQSKIRNLAKKQDQLAVQQKSGIPPQINQAQPPASSYNQNSITQTQQSQYQARNNQGSSAQNFNINTYNVYNPKVGMATMPESKNMSTSDAPYNPNQLKNLEEKLIGQMKNMQMRFNQKFQQLHLQVIRQMQMSVQKMAQCFQKSHNYQKQLQTKIKQLQTENENLRKRTY